MGAITFIDGFDLVPTIGDLNRKWQQSSSSGSSIQPGRFTGQAVRIGIGNFTMQLNRTLPATTSLAIGFAFRNPAFVTANSYFLQFQTGAGGGVGLATNTDGTITIRNAAGAVIGTTAALLVNTWYYLELELTFSTTVGVANLFIDGISSLALTGQNLGASTTTVQFGAAQSRGGSNGSFDIDDLYLVTGAASTRVGECRIDVVRPESDTATRDFTRSTGADNFALVDETLANITDYVESPTAGATDLYGIVNLSAVPAGIFAVQATALAQKTDAGPRSLQLPVKQGATQSDGTAIPLASTFNAVTRIMELDPTDGLAWTYTKVNTMLGGIKVA